MPAPVVVVHDQLDTREMALNALYADGHEVAGFEDPMAALDAIDAGSRTRVLVTRVEFQPGKLNGVALARMIRYKRPVIKVAFIGYFADRRHAERSRDFLPMPLDSDDLVQTVRRLFDDFGLGDRGTLTRTQGVRRHSRPVIGAVTI